MKKQQQSEPELKAEFSVSLVRKMVESWLPIEEHEKPSIQPIKEKPVLYNQVNKAEEKVNKKLMAIKKQIELSKLAKLEKEEESLIAQEQEKGKKSMKRTSILDQYLDRKKKKPKK